MSASTESTSAELRRTQEALAASQQDLTHVERQLRDAERERLAALADRDEADTRYLGTIDLLDAERAKRGQAEQGRDAAVADGDRIAMRLVDATVERDELAAALDREHGLLKRAESGRSELRRSMRLLDAELVSARAELEQLRHANHTEPGVTNA